MASNIKYSSLNGKSFMQMIEVPGELIASLEAAGWHMKLSTKEFTLQKDSVQYTVQMTLEFLQAIAGGQADEMAVMQLRGKIEQQIALALKNAPYAGSVTGSMKGIGPNVQEVPKQAFQKLTSENLAEFFKTHGYMAANDKIGLLKLYRQVFGVGLKDAKDAVEAYELEYPASLQKTKPMKAGVSINVSKETIQQASLGSGKWPVFDLTKLTTAPVVKLRDAQSMYQPVRGTSSSSRYFMVAANDDVRVAARYTGGSISIRIEGPAWAKYKQTIADAGFTTVDTSKDYASLHLEVGNLMLANKSLGAVLLGLGVPFETPLPSLLVIKGKGG